MPSDHELRAAVDSILGLRRVERDVEPTLRHDVATAREYIESSLGPTARAATAARLLGVSQTALNRWLNRGDISTVITPQGRREIPLDELLGLLEQLASLDSDHERRPLASVLRERSRAAERTVDIDRLLPRARGRTHRSAELQALAYHRLVAERLDDQLVEQARRRLASWGRTGRIHSHWASEWERLLARPLPAIAKAISADTPHARELRQTSPFAGALNEHERKLLVEAVERRGSGA